MTYAIRYHWLVDNAWVADSSARDNGRQDAYTRNSSTKQSSFITLTYNQEQIPEGDSLRYRDYQLFMKKLRKHIAREQLESKEKPTKCTPPLQWGATENQGEINLPEKQKRTIRFYMCGEYGDRTNRPHYHAIIFGYDFPDKKNWRKTATGETLYTSATLEKNLGKGHTTIGEVTFESAAYVARYIMKKQNGKMSKEKYETIDQETGEIVTRVKEFNKMSLKPGIGAGWIEKFEADAYPEGKVVVRGHKSKTPRYYDKKYKKINPIGYEDLLFEREKAAMKNAHDNTKERLATKETVAKAKIKALVRTLTETT